MERSDRTGQLPGAPRGVEWSQPAIASFACGAIGVLLPCCPIFPFAAMVLGMVARVRLRARAMRGRRLAIAGIVLGATGLLGQLWLLRTVAAHLDRSLRSEAVRVAEEAWRAASAGDAAAASLAAGWEAWDPALPALLEVAAEASRRHGELRHLLLAEFRVDSGEASPTAGASVTWQFERRRLVGSIRWRIGPELDLQSLQPKIRLESLLVSDAREGDLELSR